MGEKGEDTGEGWRSLDLNESLTTSEGEEKAGFWMLPRLLCRQRRLSKAAGTFGSVTTSLQVSCVPQWQAASVSIRLGHWQGAPHGMRGFSTNTDGFWSTATGDLGQLCSYS